MSEKKKKKFFSLHKIVLTIYTRPSEESVWWLSLFFFYDDSLPSVSFLNFDFAASST